MAKLPIEPLDKARWDRIEHALRDRLDRESPIFQGESEPTPRRPVAVFALVGIAAALVGAIAWEKLRPSHPAPQIASVMRVETHATPSHVEVGTSSLEVAAHTTARIEGNDDIGVLVLLDHGAIDCEVAPRQGRPPFVVRAGDVNVRVVGTHFHVDHEDGATHVTVQRGVVLVESHDVTTSVGAGSTWPTTAQVAPTPSESPAIASAAPTPRSTGAFAQPSASVTIPSPSPRERYDRALTLEASSPDEALAIYRDLRAGEGSWAMNALYAEARLDLERGKKDEARKLFTEYLQRYPSGPNAHDASELRAKLQ